MALCFFHSAGILIVAEAMTQTPPRAVSPSPHTLSPRRARSPPSAHTPRARRLGHCPPAAQAVRRQLVSIRRLLQTNQCEKMRTALDEDGTLLHTPLLDRGCEALLLAAVREGSNKAMVRLLLAHGAPVDQRDGLTGLTALETISRAPSSSRDDGAAFRVRPSVSEDYLFGVAVLLLRYGANPARPDADGLTPSDWAERSGHKRLALLLRYWHDSQTVQWLRAVMARSPFREAAHEVAPELLHLPPDVVELTCAFLAPEGCATERKGSTPQWNVPRILPGVDCPP